MKNALLNHGYGSLIAEKLTEDHILIPSAYHEKNDPSRARCQHYLDPYVWSGTTVGYILDRQEYLGHTILGKTIGENFKTKKRRFATPDELMIFPNTHEAIIDQETWEKAQKLRKRCPKRLANGQMTHRMSGMVFCADCGARMAFISASSKHRKDGTQYESDNAFQCGNYKSIHNKCSSHFIKASTLETLVLDAIRAVTEKVLEDEVAFAQQLVDRWEKGITKNLLITENRSLSTRSESTSWMC